MNVSISAHFSFPDNIPLSTVRKQMQAIADNLASDALSKGATEHDGDWVIHSDDQDAVNISPTFPGMTTRPFTQKEMDLLDGVD